MDVLTIIVAIVAVVAIVALFVALRAKAISKTESVQHEAEFQMRITELELQLEQQRSESEMALERVRNEGEMRVEQQRSEAELRIEQLNRQAELQLAGQKREAEIQLESVRSMADARLSAERERYASFEKAQEELRKSEKDNYEKMRAEQESQFEKRLATMKAEFEKLANEILERKSEGMKQVNKESLDNLLTPLREKLDSFKNEVAESKKSGIETSSKMEQIIKGLIEQTNKLGCDANNLAEALKSKPKMQGNWGEAILKDILQDSGLREGEEFFVQSSVNDEHGNRLIPDVVVKFAEKGSVVIDSKVSLKAYAEYMCCDEESHRELHLKSHLDSVRQHVKELDAKSYSSHVKDSVDMVLMFIPNEGAYILAMQNDPKLFTDAYRSKVLIINPTNLMLSLNIIYSMWQSRRQERNVEKIIQSATGLYEKFSVFSKTFVEMRGKIDSLSNSYNEAEKQLTTGRGNVVKQLNDLKVLGVMPKKEIDERLVER